MGATPPPTAATAMMAAPAPIAAPTVARPAAALPSPLLSLPLPAALPVHDEPISTGVRAGADRVKAVRCAHGDASEQAKPRRLVCKAAAEGPSARCSAVAGELEPLSRQRGRQPPLPVTFVPGNARRVRSKLCPRSHASKPPAARGGAPAAERAAWRGASGAAAGPLPASGFPSEPSASQGGRGSSSAASA